MEDRFQSRMTAAQRLTATEVVQYHGATWIITHVDKNVGWVYLREMRDGLRSVDFSLSDNQMVPADRVQPTGQQHPLFKAHMQAEDYVIVPTHLGPLGPANVVGQLAKVDRQSVQYWRSDGVGRQTVPVSTMNFWLLAYADPATGKVHYQRDVDRFVLQAEAWWANHYRHGAPIVYDCGVARLQQREEQRITQASKPVQLSLEPLPGHVPVAS